MSVVLATLNNSKVGFRPQISKLHCKISATRASSIRVMAAQEPRFEIAVKGFPETNTLADCPFSHRALLTLEEKKIPYTRNYIDFDNKPQWLLDVNPNGSVPVMKDNATGAWITDSGVIADTLEEKFPDPKLGTSESAPQVGLDLFPAFVQFLKSSAEEAPEKEANLIKSLTALEEHLKSNGPFIGGSQVCATDLNVMPKLYHCREALKHFKQWELPTSLVAVRKYMDEFEKRESWKNTYYSPEMIVKGWGKALGK